MKSSPGPGGLSHLQACCGVLQTPTNDDDRRQRALLVWPPTLCVGGRVITVIIKYCALEPEDCRHSA